VKTLYGLLVLLLLPVLCAALFVGLFVLLIDQAIPQLPAAAQGPVSEWMLDVPQETFDMAGVPGDVPYSGGQIPKDGYDGPQSFACILPPEIGHLSDFYGVVRENGYVHSGIDYSTYYKSVPVRSPMGGKVVFAGWSTVGYGNLVVIENAGYQVYLAHNTDFGVVEGQMINAGDVIGMSGTTGSSTGYHVHFEVRVWDEKAERWVPRDPNSIFLPGQSEYCDWYSLAAGE
jgi:murein DD-endopeptidase MepM/ murein hydrolase activator NlpD